MKRILLTSVLLTTGMLVMAAMVTAGIPQLINYQGRLTNSSGNPLDTTVSITFSIYTDSVGGTPIWTETYPSISTVKGLFSVILGSQAKLLDLDICWDPVKKDWSGCDYMGITVGASPEITPRTRLTSAVYSIVSEHVSTLDSALGGTIRGGFQVIDTAASPKGPTECNIGGTAKFKIMPSGQDGELYVRTAGNAIGVSLEGANGLTTTKRFKLTTSPTAGYSLISDAVGEGTWGVPTISSDLDWDKDPALGTSVLFTHSGWGIARAGNTLWGTGRNTHVNLGNGCTTGRSGQNYESAVVGGGVSNQAIGHFTTIGGGHSNVIGNGNVPAGDEARLATIAGGYMNEVHGVIGFVGGGEKNKAYDMGNAIGGGSSNEAGVSGGTLSEGAYASISGGLRNYAQGYMSTIGGGYENQAAGIKSTIGGGDSNYVAAGALSGTISGGHFNAANDIGATISGGYYNITETSAPYATIGGGNYNRVTDYAGTIAGGELDTVLAEYGTVGGGNEHYINTNAIWGTVAGGNDNRITDSGGAILGGQNNTAAGSFAGIGGGKNNMTLGHCSVIPGGNDNRANGRFSLAAGQQAQSLHDGSFVWNDNAAGIFASTAQNQFLIHAAGNTGIMTNAPHSTLHDTGSFAVAIYRVNPPVPAGYTLGPRDCIVPVNWNAPGNIFLPPAAGIGGRMYTIKNISLNPAAIVTVLPTGGSLIDGAGAGIPLAQWRAKTFVSDGGLNWYIMSAY